jgi:succinyl-CoA synthetase beta subunit
MNIHEYQARQLLRDQGIPVKPESLSCPATEGPRAAGKKVLAICESNKPLHHR